MARSCLDRDAGPRGDNTGRAAKINDRVNDNGKIKISRHSAAREKGRGGGRVMKERNKKVARTEAE